jgi:hypothetical protein
MPKHAVELTKREQETYNFIKASGKKGIDVETLMNAIATHQGRAIQRSTLQPRVSKLIELNVVRAERQPEDARKVTYLAV